MSETVETSTDADIVSTRLDQAGQVLVDLLADVEPVPIVVGSYEIALSSLNEKFGRGAISLIHISDIDDGLMGASWRETMDHDGNVVVFDYEWSVNDPTHRWVESAAIYYDDRVNGSSNRRVPISPNHAAHLNKILRDFASERDDEQA